jgi:predicted metal-binding protein
MTATELIICTTCRPAGTDRSAPAPGQALLNAVQRVAQGRFAPPSQPTLMPMPMPMPMPTPLPAQVRVRGVACISSCSRACTVALQAAGKLSYVFGDLQSDAETAAQVLACAELHAASADGQLARNDRPERLRNGILLRLPPLERVASGAATAAPIACTPAP